MDIKEFTITLDEYVVVDPVERPFQVLCKRLKLI